MGKAALTIDSLGVNFSGFQAVEAVTIIVEEGELRVLLGANGAGKTTLMDLICGKTKSTSGSIHLFDTNITRMAEFEIARAGIGRKFQVPSVFKELPVRRNLEVAGLPSHGIFSNLGFRIPAAARDKISEILQIIDLEREADRRAGSLSHGQTQWLELGILMALNPKVILLDEPTAGMTQAETEKTAEIINRLKGSHTLIVVEHDMAFVKQVAQRITVMHLGKVLAEGDVQTIEQDERVRAAYLGNKGIS
jgi:urea transport system ATP-binding protein